MRLFLILKTLLHALHNLVEDCRFVNGHLRENLSVQCDHLFGKTIHELTVRETLSSRCSVHTCDPQSSEVAFLATTMCIRMHARFHHTSLRDGIETA